MPDHMPCPAAVADRTPAGRPGLLVRLATREELAGRVLLVASVLPVLVAIAWLVVAVPLAAAGAFHAWLVVPLAGGAAVLLVRWAMPRLRAVPVRPAPWWSLLATAAVAAGFAILAAATYSEQAVLHRDAGTYAQVGLWLSQHPALTTPVPVEAFGPAADAVTFAHPGFFVQDGLIVPQFMTGWPTMLAAAFWVGGWQGMFVLPALVGGAAVLAVAGLAARLCGARWAAPAALLLALAWPVLRVSQTTYSEPLACLMLAGGISLLIDGWSLAAGRTRSRMDAPARRDTGVLLGLAGLVLSGGQLVRLDMGVDFALVVPVVGWWCLRRRAGAAAFAAGAVLGGGLGLLDSRFVTWPYVQLNWESVRLMVLLLVVAVTGTVVTVAALRWRGAGPLPVRRRSLTGVAVAAVVVGGALLAARPLLYVDHSITAASTIDYVASHQQRFGLPVDGTRSYAEQSLSWVSWYVGWPALVLAWSGAMLAAAGVARGRDWRLLPVLLVYGGSGVATLLRPAITPDHPWADRRLVVEVLPAVVLFAVVALARATRVSRAAAARPALRRAPRRALRLLPALLLVPALVPGAVVTSELAPLRTEVGEPAAAAAVCHALRPADSVILMDTQWAPTVRNQCGVPVAALDDPTVEAIRTAVAGVRAAGRDPVLMSSSTLPLLPYGLPLDKVVYLDTQEDQHQLVRRPDGTDPRRLECWIVRA
ncbi:hypothetical protein KZZ52_28225 [Dactylosporangium sp. AC04546]|uniref:hypothetical protein n=1 Tax=Dactylosporangium sp. AC04546 TaxID=2862460 RepID=UPI001EDFCAB3|nr:hypothetical protein [Dactylosporangium sp. AC04546]WVK89156.1 hypothetical protein KZZ52_28225 [Dactylosporangium sp. AC04546]